MTSSDSTKKISRFELLEQLGEGGIGVVYKAMDPLLQKVVAIKVLNAGQLSAEQQVRFQNEARTLAELKHRSIPEIFNFSISEDGAPYLVMEFVEGKSLSTLLEQKTFLPVDMAIDIVRQACNALECAHTAHILHRDIKPSNIIISEDGDIKIVDFGLAKFEGDFGDNQYQTKTGLVIGSPLYMSPERFRTAKTDVRSDIYSLGCVLFEMLTGEPPYSGETAMDTANMHIDSPLPVLPDRVQCTKVVRDNLQSILTRCLAKKPEDRFKTMRELESALQAVTHTQDEILAASESTGQSKRSVLSWVIACATLVVLVVAGRSLLLALLPDPEKDKTLHQEPQTTSSPDLLNLISGDDPWLVTNHTAKAKDISDEDFKKLANHPSHDRVTTVLVDESTVDGTGIKYLKDMRVKTIKINSPNFCDKALDCMSPTMTDLQLVRAEKLTLNGFRKIARSRISSLKLGNMRPPDGALLELTKSPNLTALYLRNELPERYHVDPKPLALMRYLFYLEIKNFDFTNKDIPIVCNIKSLTALTLENLDLNESNLKLLQSLPHLRDLRLQNTKVTSKVFPIAEGIKTLELIDLTGCANISAAEKLAFKIKRKSGIARKLTVIIDGDQTKNITGEELAKQYMQDR